MLGSPRDAVGRTVATYADLLALPYDVRAEIIAGEIITAPAPLLKHSKAQRALGSFIGAVAVDVRP